MYQIYKDDLEKYRKDLMRRRIAEMRKYENVVEWERVIDKEVKSEICRARLKSLSQGGWERY